MCISRSLEAYRTAPQLTFYFSILQNFVSFTFEIFFSFDSFYHIKGHNFMTCPKSNRGPIEFSVIRNNQNYFGKVKFRFHNFLFSRLLLFLKFALEYRLGKRKLRSTGIEWHTSASDLCSC